MRISLWEGKLNCNDKYESNDIRFPGREYETEEMDFGGCPCVGVGSMQLPYKLDLAGVDEVD